MAGEERIIRAGEVYGIDELMRRAGWSRHAYRNAKRRGLKVVMAGKRGFVTGDAFIAYLDAVGRAANANEASVRELVGAAN